MLRLSLPPFDKHSSFPLKNYPSAMPYDPGTNLSLHELLPTPTGPKLGQSYFFPWNLNLRQNDSRQRTVEIQSLWCQWLEELFLSSWPLGPWNCTQFSSVQSLSCPTLCNPMDCSTPGFPVHHQLPELVQTHAHRVSDAIQPSLPLSFSSPPAFNPSRQQGLFQWVSSSHQVAKVSEFQLQELY